MAIITEQVGDIFSAPEGSVLIHACNAKGSWGAGVALAFKQKYPQAFRIYNQNCTLPPAGKTLSAHQNSLLGTTLLIKPSNLSSTSSKSTTESQHWIACLFTSIGYGRGVSSPSIILESTANAMEDLETQIAILRSNGETLGQCWAVKINSGKFHVPWKRTLAVLEQGQLDVLVVSPEEDGAEDRPDASPLGKTLEQGSKRKLEDGAIGAQAMGGKKGSGGAKQVESGATKPKKKGGLDGWLK